VDVRRCLHLVRDPARAARLGDPAPGDVVMWAGPHASPAPLRLNAVLVRPWHPDELVSLLRDCDVVIVW
jgi:hypothetical protein